MWIAIQNAVGARQGVGGGPGPGPGYTPPLDDYTGALVAYSIRKVRSAYSGPAIEAERFSDGATQDIEFDSNGLIDTTALTTFASGSTVGVRTWYDQSGNDNHAVQTVQANQPRIYDGSNLYKTESGKLYVRGNGSYWWELTTNITTAQSIFDSRITSSGTSVGTNFLFGNTSSYDYHSGERPGQAIYLDAGNSATYVRNGDNYENGVLRDFTSYLHSLNAQVLISMFHTSASGRINELSRDRLGVPGSRSWGGLWQETIIYGDDRSGIRAAFESNQNSYYQVTNLPDYSSGFLADYPGAAAAYSVRQLSNTAIKCMRVRRAVAPFDEKDIGFTAGGDLDEAAIVAFGGSDVLLVSAWYDQSGQSNHVTVTNPGSQPRIYNGAAVDTLLGKPSISFLTSDFLTLDGDTSNTTNLLSSTGFSHFAVVETVANNTQYISGTPTSGSQTWNYSQTATSSFIRFGGNTGLGFNYSNSSGSAKLLNTDYNGNTNLVTATKDGEVSSNSFNSAANSDYRFNAVSRFSSAYSGNISEVIIYLETKDTVRDDINTNINDYYSVYPTSGFLIDHPNAQAAYSLRQLQNLQQYAIEVERHSDNATLDIGFVGGDLDEQAIIDFAQGGVVGVRTWYDQSHDSSRDMVQTNTANQPLIYSGTALYKVGGKCAIYYDTTVKQLFTNGFAGTGNPVDIFNVHQRVSGGGFFLHWEGSGGFQVAQMSSNYILGWGSGTTGPAVDTDQHLFTATANGTTGQIRLDGVASTAGTLQATRVFNSKFAIQGRPGFPGSNPGPVIYQQEFIQYDFNHSAGDLSSIESDIQTYYSIP